MNNLQALTEYYEADRDALVKRVSHRVGGIPNAEDVVQEAFTRALVYIGSYDPLNSPLPAWFNTILVNATKDFLRQERDQGAIRVEEEFSDDLEDLALRAECIEDILGDVGAMDEPAREVIRQFVFFGTPAKSIARSQNLNIHTVRKYIQDFYADIRQRYVKPV